ncbi:MAG: hypothetical protein AAGL24_22460 [Pseudomonadota bacterium]
MIRYLLPIRLLLLLAVLVLSGIATGPDIDMNYVADRAVGAGMIAEGTSQAADAPSPCNGICDSARIVCAAPCPTAITGIVTTEHYLQADGKKRRANANRLAGVPPSVEPEPPKALS